MHLDIRLGDRLSTRDQTLISEFIDANELGLALDQMADVLSEEDQPLTTEKRSDMLRLAARMGMGGRVPRALPLWSGVLIRPAAKAGERRRPRQARQIERRWGPLTRVRRPGRRRFHRA